MKCPGYTTMRDACVKYLAVYGAVTNPIDAPPARATRAPVFTAPQTMQPQAGEAYGGYTRPPGGSWANATSPNRVPPTFRQRV